jgi:hypothetical protein
MNMGNIAEVKQRLSELQAQEKELFARLQTNRAAWLSFTNLGHSLRAHEREGQSLAAKEYNRVSWEYLGVMLEIDSLSKLLP